MKKTLFFLLCIVNMGCELEKQKMTIDWKIGSTLPESNGIENIGVAGPITGIIEDKLIIIGGANFPDKKPWEGGIKSYQKELYIYQILNEGQFKLLKQENFSDSIAYAANVSFDNKIISVGGERNGIATKDVYQITLQNDSIVINTLPSLPEGLTNGSAAVVGDYLYLVGGENAEHVSNKILRLHLDNLSNGWEEFADLPYAVSHSVAVNLDNQRLVIIGGRKRNLNAKSDIYDDVIVIDVKDKSIRNLPNMSEPLAAGTAVNYNGNLIVIGGDNGETFHKVEEYIADIHTTDDEAIKNKLITEKNSLQSSHPGFSKKVWMLSKGSKEWKALNDLNHESPVTTTALLINNKIILPSGEIKAGVRTNQILIGEIR